MGGVDGIDTFNPIDLLGLSLQINCHFLQADMSEDSLKVSNEFSVIRRFDWSNLS